MSCRRQLDGQDLQAVVDAPSAERKWKRWPGRVPKPCNDNPFMPWARARTISAVAIGGLVALAAVVGVLSP
jgi:hypothetical protein